TQLKIIVDGVDEHFALEQPVREAVALLLQLVPHLVGHVNAPASHQRLELGPEAGEVLERVPSNPGIQDARGVEAVDATGRHCAAPVRRTALTIRSMCFVPTPR